MTTIHHDGLTFEAKIKDHTLELRCPRWKKEGWPEWPSEQLTQFLRAEGYEVDFDDLTGRGVDEVVRFPLPFAFRVQVRDMSRTGLQWEIKLTRLSGPANRCTRLRVHEMEQRPSYEDVAEDADRVAARLVALGASVVRGPDFFLDGAVRLKSRTL